MDVSEWFPAGPGTPLNMWLETKRDDEKGTNVCFARLLALGDEPEWVSRDGRTTVTHSTFTAPTHWRWPNLEGMDEHPVVVNRDRVRRQSLVVDWGRRAFGPDHMMDKTVRAARFFEESSELVQAVGLSFSRALIVLISVYRRTPGQVPQEIGGVANTLMSVAHNYGTTAEACEVAEINRCLSKNPAHFAQRNLQKVRDIDEASPVGIEADVAELLYQETRR